MKTTRSTEKEAALEKLVDDWMNDLSKRRLLLKTERSPNASSGKPARGDAAMDALFEIRERLQA